MLVELFEVAIELFVEKFTFGVLAPVVLELSMLVVLLFVAFAFEGGLLDWLVMSVIPLL